MTNYIMEINRVFTRHMVRRRTRTRTIMDSDGRPDRLQMLSGIGFVVHTQDKGMFNKVTRVGEKKIQKYF